MQLTDLLRQASVRYALVFRCSLANRPCEQDRAPRRAGFHADDGFGGSGGHGSRYVSERLRLGDARYWHPSSDRSAKPLAIGLAEADAQSTTLLATEGRVAAQIIVHAPTGAWDRQHPAEFTAVPALSARHAKRL